MKNERTMGEKKGWWVGLEVEATQFRSEPTVFFSRFRIASAMREDACFIPPKGKRLTAIYCNHVFLAAINPRFWERADGTLPMHVDGNMSDLIKLHLTAGKKVTVEDWASNASFYTDIRLQYPDTFCLLAVIEMPKLEVGAFAVKVAPPTLFQELPFERQVAVAEADKFDWNGWDAYSGDVDGS